MKKVSKHITYKEATHSNYAKQYKIANKPSSEDIENMELLAEKVFEPLREWVEAPIKVNSMFRSVELIWEYGAEPKWLHVSYVNEKDNRKQVLVIKRKGRYTTWSECENC